MNIDRDICSIASQAVKTGKADADSILYGEARSILRGLGYEYIDYRPYFYGDDVRYIDWRVSARLMTNPYSIDLVVKEYMSERRINIAVFLDLHNSLLYWDKLWILLHVLTIMLSLAHKLHDQIYLTILNGYEKYLVPTSKPYEVIEYVRKKICSFRELETHSGLGKIDEILYSIPRPRGILVFTDYAVEPETFSFIGRVARTLDSSLAYILSTHIYEQKPPLEKAYLTIASHNKSVQGDLGEIYRLIRNHIIECRAFISIYTRKYLEIPSIKWIRENIYRVINIYQEIRTRISQS